jgi:hypothetical protein
MVRSRKPPRAAPFALYWCTTPDGDEDWFVVARSAAEAARFHESAEGYASGDARAERVAALPGALLVKAGWRDGAEGMVHTEAGWPSEALLLAAGGEIATAPSDHGRAGAVRDWLGDSLRDVRFGDRVFRSGDVVENVQRGDGEKHARMSVFKGGKG